jgi:hypothetical protein
MVWPLNSGAAGRDSAPPVAARTAPGSASQNSCAPRWPGRTDRGRSGGPGRPAGPRVQQRRLPAAGGRRDDRYASRPRDRAWRPGRNGRSALARPRLPRDRPMARHVGHHAISSRHSVRVTHRTSPLDHRNPVMTSHLPGGEPEHALNDQIRSGPEGDALCHPFSAPFPRRWRHERACGDRGRRGG